MILFIVAAITLGFLAGHFAVLPETFFEPFDSIIIFLLMSLFFSVGAEAGSSRSLLRKVIKDWKRYLPLPVLAIAGSVIFSGVFGVFLLDDFFEGAAIGAGISDYALSGILIARIITIDTGLIAFLANILRETISIVLSPALSRNFGSLSMIAAAGTASRDSALSAIRLNSDEGVVSSALAAGILMRTISPLFVAILSNLS